MEDRLAAAASRFAVSRKSMVCPVESTGSVQISVLPFDPDVGLINAIARIGAFQVGAAALIQFRPVDLDPAPDATGMDEQTTFERHLGHVRKRDRKPRVPPRAPKNDVARIVTPFEGIRRGDGHVSPYQNRSVFSRRCPSVRYSMYFTSAYGIRCIGHGRFVSYNQLRAKRNPCRFLGRQA